MTHSPNPTSSEIAPASGMATKVRNFIVVSVAVVLSVLVILGIRTQTPTASLESLAAEATPLETALVNGKPSLMEFYANWCTSCQAMAGDMADLRATYHDQVNFVMLNVDNTKWLPEMLHYRVDGIPHFVYLDESGETAAMAIGEQPKTIIASNLEALLAETELPGQATVGRTSNLEEGVSPAAVANNRSDNPRSHGSQAAN
ncbi:MAG: thioredoxin fold domain-containing protein [Leptolyngbya sp. SIO1D8]|nr:thioredoxin fold domain-containing protein [Leptolyngbya sp. SIO1D8]